MWDVEEQLDEGSTENKRKKVEAHGKGYIDYRRKVGPSIMTCTPASEQTAAKSIPDDRHEA